MNALRSFRTLFVVAMSIFAEDASSDEGSSAGPGAEDQFEVLPISDLPPNIRFEDGRDSMRVDYAAAKDGVVPIYRINATEDSVFWVPQWSPIIRETRADDGMWYRCDRLPDDIPDWAPKSKLPSIPSGHFCRTSARLNSVKGHKRPIRFVAYSPHGFVMHSSNAGRAVVDLQEASFALSDMMRGGHPTFDELALLALGEIKLPQRYEKYEKISITRLIWSDTAWRCSSWFCRSRSTIAKSRQSAPSCLTLAICARLFCRS